MRRFAILLGLAVVVGVVFAIVAGYGHVTQPAVSATPAHWTGPYPARETLRVQTTLDIYPTKTGEHVPTANFAVRPGVPVILTIRNYTRETHTFSSRALGLDFTIARGSPSRPSVTRFTFVAPYGIYAWRCTDCPGDMQGTIYAFVGARNAQAA